MREETFDSPPPHNAEAEKAACGCLLTGEQSMLHLACDQLTPQHFYDLRWRGLFERIMTVHSRGDAVDAVTVYSEDPSALPVAELNSAIDSTPTALNLPYYIKELETYRKRRLLIAAAVKIQAEARDGDPDLAASDIAEELIQSLEAGRVSQLPWKEVLNVALDRMEQVCKGVKPGISTGFRDYDKMTGGLHKKELAIIAARPSVGKTAIALNMAEHMLKAGRPGGIISLEMPGDALAMRMASSLAGVNGQSMTQTGLTEGEFRKVAVAVATMAKWPFLVDDRPGLSIGQVRSIARKWKAEAGIEWIMVDYLQLMTAGVTRYENREREVSIISSGLKGIAKELDVAMVALSQLNRSSDKEERRPRLSDLRESGSLEQDADLVAFLYRPDITDMENVDMVIGKQRNGPIGEIGLRYRKEFTRFEQRPKVDPADIPEEDEIERLHGRVHVDKNIWAGV